MEIKKVNGQLIWHVFVDCPHCGASIDLEEQHDDDYALVNAVFGNFDKPSDWKNIGITYCCSECDEFFELEDIEY